MPVRVARGQGTQHSSSSHPSPAPGVPDARSTSDDSGRQSGELEVRLQHLIRVLQRSAAQTPWDRRFDEALQWAYAVLESGRQALVLPEEAHQPLAGEWRQVVGSEGFYEVS